MLDSVIRANQKHYPKTLLEERKYKIRKNKMENLINDNLDLSSSDESDNNNNNNNNYCYNNNNNNNSNDDDESLKCMGKIGPYIRLVLLLLKRSLIFHRIDRSTNKNIFVIEILKCTFIII